MTTKLFGTKVARVEDQRFLRGQGRYVDDLLHDDPRLLHAAVLRSPHAHARITDINVSDVAELWRRGSVIGSWLLDLTAAALAADPEMSKFAGRVSDSGEGRWTIKAAIDEAVPAPVLTAALYSRFASRGEADFQNKLLSAMRMQFDDTSIVCYQWRCSFSNR